MTEETEYRFVMSTHDSKWEDPQGHCNLEQLDSKDFSLSFRPALKEDVRNHILASLTSLAIAKLECELQLWRNCDTDRLKRILEEKLK